MMHYAQPINNGFKWKGAETAHLILNNTLGKNEVINKLRLLTL